MQLANRSLTVFFKALLLGGFCLSVSGCAGAITAWKSDPLQSYDVLKPSIYTMTGDRRTAVMMEKNPNYRFCAESLPDAVAAFAASSKAKAAVTGQGEAGFEDATSAALLQTFQRTEIAEVYRQMGWNTCLAWLQGAIDDDEYHLLLAKMIDGGLDAIKSRASQQIPTAAATLPYATISIGTGVSAPTNSGGAKEEPEKEAPKKDEPKKDKPE